jgi:hypothetical protein
MSTVEQRAGSRVAAEARIAEAPDREEILRLVRMYTDGFGAHNPAAFQEAFHPSARMFYTDPQGELHEVLVSEDFGSWADAPNHVTCRILALIQAGEVATVVFGFDTDGGPEASWVDIHSLLRINGIWKIMNKTATHASRADWAGLTAVSPERVPGASDSA